MNMRLLILLMAGFAASSPAFAHSAERGYVLLLPTRFIIIAGTLAVAASFALMALVKDEKFLRWSKCFVHIPWKACDCAFWVSLISAGLIAILLMRGLTGTADPLENLLSLSVWSIWWIVIVLLHPLFGNLWAGLNPLAWTMRFMTHDNYPKGLSYWPAFFLFGCFAWFQLVYPAPDHPKTLATVMLAYLVLAALGAMIFGARPWFTQADPFGVLFRFLGAAAPLQRKDEAGYQLSWPALNLAHHPILPLPGALFVVLTLSTIAYDALAASYWWLALWGINPFEYPGRSALITQSTLGLLTSFICLSLLIALCTWLALRLADITDFRRWFGAFALSLLPISIAFHASHYLTELLVNGQYFLAALGLRDDHVTTSFLATKGGSLLIFSVQTIVIVAGHIASIIVAHLMVLKAGLPHKQSLKLELPLAVLMVAFTAFGLWLLATPSVS